ncbi:hypothetical protein [Dickeya sp. CFBP 2040]|uniref:hypothetical protein n=1 Tax=Dickeya sp. CFBP 2040 TaxID=2718531 RepID=UPI001FF0C790|nr:hypothetical protein [Dickeya sp. CFBP 2040]
MSDKRHLQAVLRDIFCPDIAHQRPAANQFQAGQMGEEMTLDHKHLSVYGNGDSLWRLRHQEATDEKEGKNIGKNGESGTLLAPDAAPITGDNLPENGQTC